MSKDSKRLTVYSIKPGDKGAIWVKAGSAFINRDGSINVYLDVLPLDGKLHLREAAPRTEGEGTEEVKASDQPGAN